jgi:hypothetical protein
MYVFLEVKPRFIRKECQLRIDLTFDDRLEKPTGKRTLLVGSCGFKA